MPSESEWIDRLFECLREQEGKTYPTDLAFVDRALEEHPGSRRLWVVRGWVVTLLDEGFEDLPDDEALRCYRRAIELTPEHPQAYEEIGYHLDAICDDPAAAEPYFRQALELGADASARVGLARVLAQTGRRDAALETLAGCEQERDPDVAELAEEIRTGVWDPEG